MLFLNKIQNVLEDNFNIYRFQLNLISFWIKITFIIFVISLPFSIILGFIYSMLMTFSCFLLIIFYLAFKKKPWTINKQTREVYALLKYERMEDCYKYTFNFERVKQDYNLYSTVSLFDVPEETFREIRRNILKGKYD